MVSWSLAQVLLWGYNHYSKDIEFWLESQSGYDLVFTSSHNQMSGVNPLLSFSDLKVINRETQVQVAQLDNLLIELNTLKSILHLRPVLDEFVIDALEVAVRQQDDFSWSLDGLYPSESDMTTEDTLELNRWIDILFYQGNIDLRDAVIHLYHSEEAFDRPVKLDLLVSKDGDYTHMEGEIQGERNPIDLVFRGKAQYLPGEPDFNFDIFMEVADLDSRDWTDRFQLTEDYQLEHLASSLNIWLNWNYEGVNFVAESDLSDLSILKQDSDQRLVVSSEQVLVSGEFSDRYCSIAVSETAMLINDLNYQSKPHRLLCDYLGNWWWTTPEVDLERATSVVNWLPDSFNELKADLAVLAPAGTLNFPVVRINGDGQFRLEAELDAVSVNAWQDAPGLTRLDGDLVVENDQGYVDFASNNAVMSFPQIFAEGKPFDAIQGRVDWWYDDNNLRVDSFGISLNSADIDAVVGFAFEWEFLADEARLGLDVSISEGKAGQVPKYLPVTLNTELLSWLNTSMVDTEVSDTRLLYTLTIDPAAEVTDTLIIDTEVSGKQLVFNDLWPSLDDYSGHFELNNHDLITTISGTSLGNPVDDVSVKYPNVWKDDAFQLDISLSSQSELNRYRRFVNQSPLKETIGESISDWSFDGELVLMGDFSLSLETDDITDMRFLAFPQRASVTLPGLPKVDDVVGEISYSTEDQLVVKGLQGKALNGGIEFNLKTSGDEYQVKGRGTADIDKVLAWKELPGELSDHLEGEISYYFDAEFGPDDKVEMDIRSDLVGVTSSLPYPMTKESPEQNKIFIYQGVKQAGQIRHAIDVGPLNIEMYENEAANIDRTVVSFGRLPKESRIPDQGVFLFGRLAQLDVKAWLQEFPELDAGAGQGGSSQGTSQGKSQSPSQSIYADIAIQKAELGDLTLDNFSLSCSSSSFGHRLAIRSRQLAGTVRIPREDKNIQVDLDYVILPELASANDDQAESQQEVAGVQDADPFEAINPASIPAMDVKISKLRMGNREVGYWRGQFQPIDQGVLLSINESNAMNVSTQGKVWWTKVNDRHATFADVALTTGDIKETYKQLGYEPTLESKSARLDMFVYWDGSPAAFNKLEAQGLVSMAVEDGNFLNVSESANTLRVFGLFNLSSLSRRLKLDFSDVYTTGLAFDELSGSISINNGVVDIDDPIEILGPSANILLMGQTDMNDETLDMDMRLSVPVSGTLPLAAVVAGINPLIGGIMLIGQGVWGGVVDQFTGVDYRITGTWDEPSLNATTKVEAAVKEALDTK